MCRPRRPTPRTPKNRRSTDDQRPKRSTASEVSAPRATALVSASTASHDQADHPAQKKESLCLHVQAANSTHAQESTTDRRVESTTTLDHDPALISTRVLDEGGERAPLLRTASDHRVRFSPFSFVERENSPSLLLISSEGLSFSPIGSE